MAVRKTKTAEKIQGGGEDRVKLPGWYHAHVTMFGDTYPNGKPIEGLFFEATVFDGQPEERKIHGAPLYDPKVGDEETAGGRMAVRKQTAFLVATGLITESQMGQDVEYDTDNAIGRQIVMNLVPDNSDANAGKGFLQVSYDDILHVDDPRVADLVKAGKVKLYQPAIDLYKPFRRDPKSFDMEKLGGKKSNGNGSHAGNGQAANQQAARNQASSLIGAGAGAGAAAGGVDLDSI